MAKKIITISREFGSGGRFIGEEVAKKLGIAYYDKNINHTVPQRISGTEDCCLSLRVNRPFKDCALVVSQNGKEIARKKMKKALPAEMIHIDLKAEKLENKGDLEVKVE